MLTTSNASPFPREPPQLLQPKGRNRRKRKHRQREEQMDPVEQGSELYKRFFSLPLELRNHVYRLLLVQPCKFDMYHNKECKRLVSQYFEVGPSYMDQQLSFYRCAECTPTHSWRSSTLPVFVSPARSHWGDVFPNEFLCDKCWQRKFGNVHRPSMETLPCLCTRRQNLELLLVNKRFSQEASHVFWTENHFAFENSSLLDGFLRNVREEVKSQITRISLMAYPSYDYAGLVYTPPHKVKPVWQKLRECVGLVELELDAHYLTHISYVLGMRRLQVKRSVTFVRWAREGEVGMEHHIEGQPKTTQLQLIWPGLAFRKPIDMRETATTRRLSSELAESIVKGRPLGPKYLKGLCKRTVARQSR